MGWKLLVTRRRNVSVGTSWLGFECFEFGVRLLQTAGQDGTLNFEVRPGRPCVLLTRLDPLSSGASALAAAWMKPRLASASASLSQRAACVL